MSPTRPSVLTVSALEDRTVPAPLTALTSGNQLIQFDSAAPATITANVPVTGLLGGENLVAIDYRPSSGQLFGLATTGVTSRLYTLNPASGAATPVGAGFSFNGNNGVGFDFNPAVDKLRLVSSDGTNLRLNPDTGVILGTDTPLAFNAARFDEAIGGPAPAPSNTAAAYTLNMRDSKIVTTLYNLDSNLNALVTQGGPEGDPNPNGGQLFVVDRVNFDVTPESAFDIETGTDKAFATSFIAGNTVVYSINLTTAASATLGTIPGQRILGLAVNPPVAGSGSFALPAAALSFSAEPGAPLVVPVTRTGGSSQAATVNFATANGSAVGGVDFIPNSGTLSFMPGETTKLITLLRPAGLRSPSPERTFSLTLSDPTGGATLGTASAVVTVPATAGNVANSGRLIAVGAGAGGGPRVTVFDALTGAERYSFFAFEPTFTGGVTVATADVNGDGFDDIIVGAGNGGGPRVAVFDGSFQQRSAENRGPVLADFFAYEDTFRGGVIIATGDVNGDGFADLIAGTGVGGGPRVRVFSGTELTVGGTQASFQDFFAFEDTFRGGVNVAAEDLNGDGFAEVIAGAGNGGGPRVRTFDGRTGQNLADFFAYEDSFRGGVFVATGNVLGTGRPNIVTGTGPGGGPLVRVFDGLTPGPVASAPAFFAFGDDIRSGVRVATNDFGPDGIDEILAASGGGIPSAVRVFTPAGTQVGELPFDRNFTGGLFVG